MTEVTPANAHAILRKWVFFNKNPLVCDLAKSQGPYLHDAASGIDYLDFSGFFSTRPLGFNHPGLLEPQFVDRLLRSAIHKPSNSDVCTVEYVEFVNEFATRALGGKFAHLFFVEGGAPAVENAVKAAIDWKHRKNLAEGKGEKGSQIVHLSEGFHGRTGYALSLTDPSDVRKIQFFPRFEWPKISNPKMSFPINPAAQRDVEHRESQALLEFRMLLSHAKDDIAAIVLETIQGESGDNYFRAEFLKALREICNEQEILLIFDEIQTGFGSTGRWWDWERHNVQPDLMTFGKKSQVCGVAATTRLDEVDSVFHVPGRISSSFGGDLVDMVRCQQLIEIIEKNNLIEQVDHLGEYMKKLLDQIAEQYPEVTQIRTRGTFAAFDLPDTFERDRLIESCFEEQLLLLPGGSRSIRMRATLDIDADTLARAVAQLEAGLKRARGKTA